jgi:transcription elongation factor Elf1
MKTIYETQRQTEDDSTLSAIIKARTVKDLIHLILVAAHEQPIKQKIIQDVFRKANVVCSAEIVTGLWLRFTSPSREEEKVEKIKTLYMDHGVLGAISVVPYYAAYIRGDKYTLQNAEHSFTFSAMWIFIDYFLPEWLERVRDAQQKQAQERLNAVSGCALHKTEEISKKKTPRQKDNKFYCPCCGNEILLQNTTVPIFLYKEERIGRCYSCGQTLNWSKFCSVRLWKMLSKYREEGKELLDVKLEKDKMGQLNIIDESSR